MNEHERLLALMKEEHMNAKEFAEQVGISAATMSNIVNGRNNPSLDVMQKILHRFRLVNSEWLILGVGSMYQEKNDSPSDKNQLFTNPNSPEDDPEYIEPVITNVSSKDTLVDKSISKKSASIITGEKKIAKRISKIVVFYDDGTFDELVK